MATLILKFCLAFFLAAFTCNAAAQISPDKQAQIGVPSKNLPQFPTSLGLLEEVNRLNLYNTYILEHNALALQYLEARRAVNRTWLWGLGFMAGGIALGATDPSQSDDDQEAGWQLYTGSAFVAGGFITMCAAPAKRRNALQSQIGRALSKAQSLYTVQRE